MRCDHCLREIGPSDEVQDAIDGVAHRFCCHGCAGVFRFVQTEGLGTFYGRSDRVALDAPVDRRGLDVGAYTPRAVDGQRELTFAIDGLHCASCVWLNEQVLARTPGVSQARVSYATHRATVRYDGARLELATLLGRVQAIGYTPRPYQEHAERRRRSLEVRDLTVRFGTAAFLASQLMVYTVALYAGYFEGIDAGLKRLFEVIAALLTLPVLAYSGATFFTGAVRSLRHGRLGMDALIALGAATSYGYSLWAMAVGREVYFDTAAMIVTLVLLGRLLEAQARLQASELLWRLGDLLPSRAQRRTPEGAFAPAAVAQLAAGDVVMVQTGEVVPVDGVVVEGAGEADEALLTGEPRPVGKAAGSEVIAGARCVTGPLLVEVRGVGEGTLLAGILRSVDEAQAHRPRVQALADRLVAGFVPAVLLLALATLGSWVWQGAPWPQALSVAVAVVVIACPCALGLATPLAVLMATQAAATRGLLIRDGEAFERARRLTQAIFDKTGTLTRGLPEVTAVLSFDGSDPTALLARAAAVERQSEHHLARAVVKAWQARAATLPRGAQGPPLKVEEFCAEPGHGVGARVEGVITLVGNRGWLRRHVVTLGAEADATAAQHERAGGTVLFVAWAEQLRGLLVVADAVRPEASAALAALRALGLQVTLLTGDHPDTAKAVAQALGIVAVVAGVTPEQKRSEVAARQQGGGVLMVGDGINDGPALAAAQLGVAMGRGAVVAQASAHVVLLRDDLTLVPLLLAHARRTRRIMVGNLFWALVYNLVAVPLAVAGWLHPIVAAAAMACSSLFVVLNSWRLQRGTVGPSPLDRA